MKIYDLHKNDKIELTKQYEFEAVYMDNSMDGITTVKKIKCEGKDSKYRVVHITINYDNDASASWNPEKFDKFRQVIIKRACAKKI